MHQDASWLDTAGRLLLVAFFLAVGIRNLQRQHVDDHVKRLTNFKTPFPKMTFWIGQSMEFAGCALVLLELACRRSAFCCSSCLRSWRPRCSCGSGRSRTDAHRACKWHARQYRHCRRITAVASARPLARTQRGTRAMTELFASPQIPGGSRRCRGIVEPAEAGALPSRRRSRSG